MDPAGNEMRTGAGRKVVRLGPIALRILSRRRRWIRWLALILAGLTVFTAIAHVRHRSAVRPPEMPAVIIRHALRAGQPIRLVDVALESREESTAGPAPFRRIEDVLGRVAARGLGVNDPVTPENAVPAVRYYGVAARVPRSMRAVNLVVPSAAAFGGELAPLSRVDLLGAFELGQERAAATVLTSGIVLRVMTGRDAPGRDGQSPAGGRPGLPPQGGSVPGGLVEVVVAVPEAREREVALAQAFGRVFLAVHSLSGESSSPDVSAAVNLRKYLNLPPATSTPAPAPSQRWPFTLPVGTPSGVAAPGGRGGGRVTARTDAVPSGRSWIVEVIKGTGERSAEQVPLWDSR